MVGSIYEQLGDGRKHEIGREAGAVGVVCGAVDPMAGGGGVVGEAVAGGGEGVTDGVVGTVEGGEEGGGGVGDGEGGKWREDTADLGIGGDKGGDEARVAGRLVCVSFSGTHIALKMKLIDAHAIRQ